jgi:hypothetical protein
MQSVKRNAWGAVHGSSLSCALTVTSMDPAAVRLTATGKELHNMGDVDSRYEAVDLV